MSYADKVFKENVKDILENGVWDTDMEVRPRWLDGTPAHTVKKFCIVNRYDLSKEFPIMTIRKQGFKTPSTKYFGYGRKNPTESPTFIRISGTAGRAKTERSAKHTAISSALNINIKRVCSIRWTEFCSTLKTTPRPAE